MKHLKYLLIVLIGLFFFIPKVNAEDVTLKPADFKINSKDFYTGIRLFTFAAHQDANTPTTTELIIWYDAVANSYDMPYLILDICSTQKFTAQRSNKGECQYYGCLINPRVYDIKKTCDADGYTGKVYRLYFDIAEWVGSRENGDEMFILNTNIKFYPLQYETYGRFGNLINGYLSDTDDGSSWAQSQSTENAIGGVNDSVNKVDDSINNSTVDSPSSKFEEFENMLPENGVITELITLPISLFQNVLGSINGTCTEYNLGNLLGTDLRLPCINISNYIGTTLWNVIDILFSGFFVLAIGKKMIKAFNGFTSMEEGDVLD